ncbi:MAG: caspase family protein [Anaerolineales bacterium]|jgi:hypothetical protein
MAENDWAIIVGINAYPAISEAVGAEADARAFHTWLVSPQGGAVPNIQAELIVTSEYGAPPDRPENARPTAFQLYTSIEQLLSLGETTGGHIGRRLYLYFAGHGIAPGESDTALLMANAHKGAMGSLFHWLGEYTAELFRQSAYFDEVLLFMDCCREVVPIDGLNRPWSPRRAANFNQVKRCYAYATRFAQVAWARPLASGEARGEFTVALLEGLNGAAYVPQSEGAITSNSLKMFLLDRLTGMQESDFHIDDFLITRVQPAEYPVSILLPEQIAGEPVQLRVVRANRFQVFKESPAAPPSWEISLEKGFYDVQVLSADLRAEFEVDGTGGLDVKLS